VAHNRTAGDMAGFLNQSEKYHSVSNSIHAWHEALGKS
jgi:hypothetical protein